MDNFDLRKYLAEGRLFEEDFKNPILDKYLELKKSVDNNTAFEYELSDFINDLDNTEREGLERDLGLERDELYEGRLLKEEIDYSSIKDEMKKIYDIDVDLDTIKDFVTSYNDSEGMDVFDTTEREDFYLYLKDLAEGKLFEEEQWFDPSSPSHGKGYKILGDEPQEGAFYVSGYDFENDKSFEYYVLDPNYNKYLTATQELLGLADEQGHEYESIEQYYDTVEAFQNDLRSYAKGGKFEGDEVPNWLMQDLAMSFGTDYDQFYSDDEDEDYDEEEYEDY